jgi:hypothetical protein
MRFGKACLLTLTLTLNYFPLPEDSRIDIEKLEKRGKIDPKRKAHVLMK